MSFLGWWRALLLGLVLGAAMGCAEEDPRTEILLLLDADGQVRSRTERLRVTLRGEGDAADVIEREIVYGDDEAIAWPRPVAVIPKDGDAERSLEAVVEALEGDATSPFVTARLIADFIEGETVLIRITLTSSCIGVACNAEQTCVEGSCMDPSAAWPSEPFDEDAGLPEPDDGGLESPFDDLPPLGVDGAEADYSCLRTRTAPSGPSRSFTLELADFQTSAPVADACVDIFDDNQVPVTETCTGSPTDMDGLLSVTGAEGGWFAYRAFPPSGDFVETLGRNLLAPEEGGAITVDILPTTAVSVLAAAFGIERDPVDALLIGTVVDCNGAPVEGAAIRVVVGDRVLEEGTGAQDLRYLYFDGGGVPEADRDHTASDGLSTAINVPVDADGQDALVVACGTVDGSDVEVVGCERMPLFGGAVHVLDIGPTRADGPACPEVCY